MKKIIFCLLAILLVSCSANANSADIEKAVAETLAAQVPGEQNAPCPECPPAEIAAELPTYTPYPPPEIYSTYTPFPPLPTYTPQTLPEPITILVTATAPPGFTQIYQFTGNNSGTTDLFSLQPGTIRIKWEYMGDSNFISSIKELDTEEEESISNAIGNSNGQTILKIEQASANYLLDIMIGRGDWKITIEYRP